MLKGVASESRSRSDRLWRDLIQLTALVLSSIAAYLPHLLFGDRLSFFGDFALGTLVGGAVYVVSIYQLRKLRGDF